MKVCVSVVLIAGAVLPFLGAIRGDYPPPLNFGRARARGRRRCILKTQRIFTPPYGGGLCPANCPRLGGGLCRIGRSFESERVLTHGLQGMRFALAQVGKV